jgi:3-oxoacyl-[acyl-carrier protein] reductase
MPRLEDRVIIVTGGASGLGKAYCEALSAEGAKVVVADINANEADVTARQIEDSGGEAFAVHVDVADPEATQAMARETVDKFGRIDGLVANAAFFQRPALTTVPFDELPIEEWDRVMAVNLKGVFLSCRAVAPTMKAQGSGKIITVSSSTTFYGLSLLSHYVASKSGVIGLTRVMANELGGHNINVNCLAPGGTVSMDLDDDRMRMFETRAQLRAIKRIETPKDLSGTVVFLCSSESDFITGQTIVVDGGMYMH